MFRTAHRLQCKTPHFPKHKFPIHTTRSVQTQLKSTVSIINNYISRSIPFKHDCLVQEESAKTGSIVNHITVGRELWM